MPVTRSTSGKQCATSESTRDWSAATPSTSVTPSTTTGLATETTTTSGDAGSNVPASTPRTAASTVREAGTAPRPAPEKRVEQPSPAEATLFLPPAAARSKSARSSKRREAELRYQLALQKLEEAKAATEVRRAQMALEEASSDEEADEELDLQRSAHVEQWLETTVVHESVPLPTSRPVPEPSRPLRSEKSDIEQLAHAIMRASGRQAPSGAASAHLHALPAFTGAIEEWLGFKRQFDDTAALFSPTQNMARLRRSVSGNAQEAVRSLLLVSSDPSEVMAALARRFGRPDAIIIAETEKLRRHPAVTDAPRDVCAFASKVHNAVATMRALGKTQYFFSPELCRVVIEKLPPIARYRWFDYRARAPDGEEPELLVLDRFLSGEADLCGSYVPPEAEKKSSRPRQVNAAIEADDDLVATAMGAATRASGAGSAPRPGAPSNSAANNSAANTKRTCVVCNGEHWAGECKVFLQAENDERWKMAIRYKLCFRCLRSRHQRFNCRAPPCKVCKRGHHTSLHSERKTETPAAVTPPNEVNTAALAVSSVRAYLKILPVELYGPKGSATVLALLDEGSTLTMLEEAVAKQIGVVGTPEKLEFNTVGGSTVAAFDSYRADLKVRGTHQKSKFMLRNVRTMPALNLPLQGVNEEVIKSCKHLRGIERDVTYPVDLPKMLIGQDNWSLIVSRKIRQGTSSQPVASLTRLGWVLHGVRAGVAAATVNVVTHCTPPPREEDALESLVKDHFSIEALGIEARRPKTDPEERALRLLDETTRRLPSGRFETGLLWASDGETLPNNRPQALRRLRATEKKLSRDAAAREQYEAQISNLIEKEYAELAPPAASVGRTFYLPHFGVIHPTKKKLRLVFDAAARYGGKCLNDALLQGPDLLQSLFGVLLRFRERPVAVMADIKEMFLQIKIREEDRDCLRFLWGDREYRMSSVVFGASSSPAIAIYVKNRNAADYAAEYPAAHTAIVNNHYMDDYLQSFDTEQEAAQTAKEVRDVHARAGFELRGWATNAEGVHEQLCGDDNNGGKTKSEVRLTQPGEEKTLGLIWRTGDDMLAFDVSLRTTPPEVAEGLRPPTKREVLSAVMSTFDPHGLLAPVLVQGKKIVQDLWRHGLQWDEAVPASILPSWRQYVEDIGALRCIALPRCISAGGAAAGELHTFVDASEEAYAAAVYWRTRGADGAVQVSLVAAKARAAPKKPLSIPRLELQAALLGSRLAKSVGEELGLAVERRVYWSDSSTVLQWINSSPRRFKTYVAHRLAEIEENSKQREWRWVPTKLNPADDATRSTPPDFSPQARWFVGPAFLREGDEDWPPNRFERSDAGTEEIRPEQVNLAHGAEPLIDVERFSSWKRLVRALGRVIQFTELCRRRRRDANSVLATTDNWKPHERRKPAAVLAKRRVEVGDKYRPLDEVHERRAEMVLHKISQREAFRDGIGKLRKGQPIKKSSRLSRIETFVDQEGVVRLHSRTNKARICEEMKSPIVLDGGHRLTSLLITDYHQRYLHANTATVVNELRQRYHVVGLRSAVRKILHRCQWCRVKKAAARRPPTGDLPGERLQHHRRPFTFTGVDYFGPMSVTVGRRTEKRWGALFTCLTTRAVHLELAPSLSASSMVMALRRMAARRGLPATIISDNGTNFVGADRELREEVQRMQQQGGVAAEMSARGVTWKFIPAGAPHMGGAWERLVRSVKTALKAVLNERSPSEETLSTLLAEVEHIVNCRPLTAVSTDPADEESLTPNHFLIGSSSGAPGIGVFTDDTLVGKADWRTAQRLADYFWRRWVKEYLPELQPRRKTSQPHTSVEVGDIVLIADGTLPRNIWPRGEIVKTLPGPDGRTRVVEVRTSGGVFRRPVSRVIVLVPAAERPTEGAGARGGD